MASKTDFMSFDDFKNFIKTRSDWLVRVSSEGIQNLIPTLSFQLFDATSCSVLEPCFLFGTSDEAITSLPADGIRLYGVTRNGLSICVNVHGYSAYFYATVPVSFTEDDLSNLKNLVNKKYGNEMKYKFDVITALDKTELNALSTESTHPIIKCYVREKRCMPRVISIMKQEMSILENGFHLCAFEDEFPLVTQFFMSCNISVCSWLSIQPGKYVMVSPDLQQSTCQLEITVSYQYLVYSDSEASNQLQIATTRILGFDIECFVRRNVFADWSIDPVIAIACVMRNGYLKTDSEIQVIFVLGSCVEVKDTLVFCFVTEEDLLNSWEYFVKITDPDIIVGYNVLGFDFEYLMSRGRVLKMNEFGNFGKLANFPDADRDYSRYNLNGRVVFDLLPIIQNECPNLSSYKLASVCKSLLNDAKEELDVNCLGELHQGTASDRGRIASYCLKDALLPLQLMDHLSIFEKYTQTALVSGLLLRSVVRSNNKSFDLLSAPLLQTAHQYGCTIRKSLLSVDSNLPKVVTPETLTLFACIVMEYNLCYRSYVPKEKINNLPPNAINKTPCGNYFLTEQNGKGVIPITIAKLLGQIQTMRVEIKSNKESEKLRLLYCRLRALKNLLRVMMVMLQSSHSTYYFLPIHSALVSYSRMLSRDEIARLRNKYFR